MQAFYAYLFNRFLLKFIAMHEYEFQINIYKHHMHTHFTLH